MKNSVVGIISFILGFLGFLTAHWYFGIFFIIVSIMLGVVGCMDYLSYKWSSVLGLVFSGLGIALFTWTLVTDLQSGRLVILYSEKGVSKEIEEAFTEAFEEAGVTVSFKEDHEDEEIQEWDAADAVAEDVSEDAVTETEDRQDTVPDATNRETEDTPEKEWMSASSGKIDASFDSFDIVYDGYEVSTDYEGNDCVIIYYNYTNTDDEPQSAFYFVNMKCFQNGVECDQIFVPSEENECIENHNRQVTSGTTLRCAQAFKISSRDDIELSVEEYLSLNDHREEMLVDL